LLGFAKRHGASGLLLAAQAGMNGAGSKAGVADASETRPY
jgi:hypothetical protein